MITVWKLNRKGKTVVGHYEGTADSMKNISNALELARRDCPNGTLIVEGVTLPERKKKEPEIK